MASAPRTFRRLFAAASVLSLAGVAGPASAAEAACNVSAGPVAYVPLPGSPFSAVATPDGCTIFVSLTGDFPGVPNSIAILHREGGQISLSGVLRDMDTPFGLVMSRDGKILVVANNTNVVLIDAERFVRSQDGLVLGYLSEHAGDNPINIYANVSPNGRLLFIAEENADRIAVVDLDDARRSGFKDLKIGGLVPAGFAPIALTFSPDGKYLYVTVQQAEDADHWPLVCKPEGEDPATSIAENPEGAIVVIDVARAESDPAHAELAKVPAGCSPVRLAISPDGGRAYVAARGDNAVYAFDTAKLLSDPAQARIASIPVGIAPVGIAAIDNGKKIVVANSNRFANGPQSHETLSVIDADSLSVDGTIEAGAFPRELAVTPDGKTLLVTNSGSDSLELIDLAQMPLVRKP